MMVSEGVNPALIENAALQFGMPIGPLALIDETALSLNYQLMESTRRDLGDAYIPLGHEGMLEKMVRELGRPGRRGGGGFYEYPEMAPKRIWPALREHFPTGVGAVCAYRESLGYGGWLFCRARPDAQYDLGARQPRRAFTGRGRHPDLRSREPAGANRGSADPRQNREDLPRATGHRHRSGSPRPAARS